ncbi:MAG: Kelch repeat-containing protein [Polyangiales bacterium]
MRRLLLAVVLVGCAKQEPERSARVQQAAFTESTHLSKPRSSMSLLTLASGDVLFTGGYDGASYLQILETWSKTSGAFSPFATAPFALALPAAIELADKRIFATGSGGSFLYDPTKKTFDFSSALATDGHRGASLALVPGPKVLLAGGTLEAPGYTVPLLFDPATKTFSSAGTMKDLRIDHGFVPLSDAVLMIGGANYDLGTHFKSVESYSPSTNSWSSLASMNTARASAVVVRLGSGKILAAGGNDGGPISLAEIYDPDTDSWSTTTTMPAARETAGAALLKSGRVLVVGGSNTSTIFASTLLFDPKTEAWVDGPSLKVPRGIPRVAALADGRVLVAGGVTGIGDGGVEILTDTVEIFGGLAAGASCVVGEECVSGICTGGTCSAAPDAGPTDAISETEAPDDAAASIDATPPDHGKPVISGDIQRCANGAQCPSGFCVDGVCCDSKCEGTCQTCVLPSSPGHCTIEPFGIDHANACGKAGTCVGTCDGKGGCTSATGGAQCRPSHCTGTSTGVSAAFCSASGSSCDESALVPFDCAPFACDEAFGACLSICKTSKDCADGFVCDATSRLCVGAPADDSGGCVFGAPSARHVGVPLLALVLAAFWRRKRGEFGAE